MSEKRFLCFDVLKTIEDRRLRKDKEKEKKCATGSTGRTQTQ